MKLSKETYAYNRARGAQIRQAAYAPHTLAPDPRQLELDLVPMRCETAKRLLKQHGKEVVIISQASKG